MIYASFIGIFATNTRKIRLAKSPPTIPTQRSRRGSERQSATC